MDHAQFSNNEVRISWVSMRPSMAFFSCRILEKSARKASPEVCEELLLRVFIQEKTHLWGGGYLSISIIQVLFSLYFFYTGCFYNLMVCSRGCIKTNKCTCTCMHASHWSRAIHTYTITLFGKQFQEISRLAATHTWFKKNSLKLIEKSLNRNSNT